MGGLTSTVGGVGKGVYGLGRGLLGGKRAPEEEEE